MASLWTYISCVTALAGYVSYLKRYEIRKAWEKLKLYSHFIPYSYLMFKSDTSTFNIHPYGKAAVITYERNGKCCKVLIPVQTRCAKMSGHKAYLIRGDHQLEITQQADVPYFVTAKDLGGDEIRVLTDDREYVFRDAEPVKIN